MKGKESKELWTLQSVQKVDVITLTTSQYNKLVGHLYDKFSLWFMLCLVLITRLVGFIIT